jgi:hypothetical protein
VKLSEKVLPSIACVDILNTYKQLNCVTLSDSGNVMACGMADSIVKVFIFDLAQHDIITMRDLH